MRWIHEGRQGRGSCSDGEDVNVVGMCVQRRTEDEIRLLVVGPESREGEDRVSRGSS